VRARATHRQIPAGRARTREDPMSAGGRRDEQAGAALGAGEADAPAHGATTGMGASMAKSGDGHSQGSAEVWHRAMRCAVVTPFGCRDLRYLR
jgi:hypothetical protein